MLVMLIYAALMDLIFESKSIIAQNFAGKLSVNITIKDVKYVVVESSYCIIRGPN